MAKTPTTLGTTLALVLSLSGCASIINGANQTIPVSSDPPGATVEVDGQGSYRTPVTLELERKRSHSILLRLEGYHTQQVTLNRTVSGAVAGNILAGGLIGWAVDAMTGAQYKLMPESVHVVLHPTVVAEAAGENKLLDAESR